MLTPIQLQDRAALNSLLLQLYEMPSLKNQPGAIEPELLEQELIYDTKGNTYFLQDLLKVNLLLTDLTIEFYILENKHIRTIKLAKFQDDPELQAKVPRNKALATWLAEVYHRAVRESEKKHFVKTTKGSVLSLNKLIKTNSGNKISFTGKSGKTVTLQQIRENEKLKEDIPVQFSPKALIRMPHLSEECPTTKSPIIFPVTFANGKTYEIQSIVKWLFNGYKSDPLIGEVNNLKVVHYPYNQALASMMFLFYYQELDFLSKIAKHPSRDQDQVEQAKERQKKIIRNVLIQSNELKNLPEKVQWNISPVKKAINELEKLQRQIGLFFIDEKVSLTEDLPSQLKSCKKQISNLKKLFLFITLSVCILGISIACGAIYGVIRIDDHAEKDKFNYGAIILYLLACVALLAFCWAPISSYNRYNTHMKSILEKKTNIENYIENLSKLKDKNAQLDLLLSLLSFLEQPLKVESKFRELTQPYIMQITLAEAATKQGQFATNNNSNDNNDPDVDEMGHLLSPIDG